MVAELAAENRSQENTLAPYQEHPVAFFVGDMAPDMLATVGGGGALKAAPPPYWQRGKSVTRPAIRIKTWKANGVRSSKTAKCLAGSHPKKVGGGDLL